MAKQMSGQQAAQARRLRRQERGSIAEKLTGPLEDVDGRVTISAMILAFWGMFWALNGAGKLMSGEHVFGVAREASVSLSAAGLSAGVSGALLYAISVAEVLLGLSFLYTLFFSRGAAILSALNFRLSLLIFLLFATAELLLGQRGELWEHVTWIALVVVSSYVYMPGRGEQEQA